MNLDSDNFKLQSIFMPYSYKKRLDVASSGRRFVHYTTAANAINIIRGREVWMRNTLGMNDFMEVEQGLGRIRKFFGNEEKKNMFFGPLDKFAHGVAESTLGQFLIWQMIFRRNTFIVSISEHDDKEDHYGRLSMWRAYGKRGVGVAIVLNSAVFMTESDALKAYSSPVTYFSDDEFESEIATILSNIESNGCYIQSMPKSVIYQSLFTMLLFGSVCSKHEGFSEEREWRIVYVPEMHKSPVIRTEVEIIDAIPQTVCKLPLMDIPEQGLIGANLNSLIDRIIVGPCDTPYLVCEALATELTKAGVEDAKRKISVSNIPVRSSSF